MAILKNSKVNMQKKQQQIGVGLDLGSSKICCLVASPDQTPNSLNILGIGITESDGITRGVITNIGKAVTSIKRAIDQAEQQSGYEIKKVVVGLSGDHIQMMQTRGIIGISNNNREISLRDVERVLEECRNIAIPSDRRILHIIPQEYKIDTQDGFTDPIGMTGTRMEAKVQIVTGSLTAALSTQRCIEKLNLEVQKMILEPLASSRAVLDEEEKEVGVAVIDIGGGTTDIAIYEDNILRFTSVVAIGGRQVTDDVRKALGIVASQAERIKKEYGHAPIDSILKDEFFMVPGVGGRPPLELSKNFLCQIIQPRMEEIYEFALNEIRKSEYIGNLGAGIVLTGGCSMIRGAEELAQDVFGMPVKIGSPSGISYSGLAQEVENPIYSTAVGLALYGLKQEESIDESNSEEENESNSKPRSTLLDRFKRILDDL